MEQVSKNSFSGGMVKDIANTKKSPETYEDALDIRLNSNSENSEYTITNIKGDTLFTNGLSTPSIITLIPDGTISGAWSITPIINGISGTAISGTGDYSSVFEALYESINTDLAFASLNLIVSIKGQRIRFYSLSSTISTFTGSGITSTVQAAQTGLIIIGYTQIVDDLYLLTTNNNTPIGGIGAIFKLTYDPVTFVATTELKYTDNLNFTTRNPIANPGGIESVYETPSIGRMYWTDRLNDLRGINIYDVNAMAINPIRLSIDSGKTLKKATLNNVSLGGAAISGLYTVSYRLRSGENSVTSYAPESGPIHIVEAAGSGGWPQYQGNVAGTITNKQFTVNFTGIDTDYSYLDVIMLRKESADARPFISKVAEIPIVNSEFTYTYTGAAAESFITEDEFTKVNEIFNVCHTIAQKDNILFAANTKGEDFEIEFDARAYRFDNTGKTILYKEDGTTIEFDGYTPTPPNTAWGKCYELATIPFNIPENTDSYNINQNTYMYQQDGTTIGGQGPNVSYTFTTTPISGDVIPSSGARYPNPWRQTWRDIDFNIDMGDNNLYTKRDNAWPSFGSEYVDHFLRGYRREEKYRFFLVFVKDGIESYQKWIADIKMPAVHQERAGYINSFEHFPLTKRGIYGDVIDDKWNVVSLGVKFTVDVSSVAAQIDGFRIKRVQLNQEDRTILGQGILHGSVEYPASSSIFSPFAIAGNMSSPVDVTPYTLNDPAITRPSPIDRFHRLISFISPDLLFGKGIDYISGDSIKVVTGLASYQLGTSPSKLFSGATFGRSVPFVPATPGNIDYFGGQVGLFKLYRNINVKYNPWWSGFAYQNTAIPIQDAKNVTQGQTAIIDGAEFKNFRRNNFIDESNLFSDTVVIACNDFPYLLTSIASEDTEGVVTPFGTHNSSYADKLLVNYVRVNNGQYGGNGYIARSNNVSINTNIDVVLNKITGITQFTLDTYGGDTFVTLFDNYRSIRNYQKYGGDHSNMQRIYGTVLCFPVESNVNTDLRHGVTPLRYSAWSGDADPVGVPDAALFPIDYGEDFRYDYTWSSQPDTNRSFSKQINVVINRINPMRIWASAKKILGERVDSFMQFKTETFIDITGKFGEIRQIIISGDKLHAFQKRAFGVASVNDRSVINDDNGSGIVLGESGVLPRFDYISQSVGAWHQFSFAQSPRGIFFYDTKDAGIYLYSDALKDITINRIKDWLYNNTRGNLQINDGVIRGSSTPLGIAATYDNRNKEFLITFHDSVNGSEAVNSFTIAYSDLKDLIVSRRTKTPSMYLNDSIKVLSPTPLEDKRLWLHDNGVRGSFYGASPEPLELTYTMNSNPEFSKVFDNIEWLSLVKDINDVELTGETINDLIVSNDYQTTGIKNSFTRRLRSWRNSIGYEFNTRNRMRAHYFKVNMKFNNNNDKKFLLNDVINYFRSFPN